MVGRRSLAAFAHGRASSKTKKENNPFRPKPTAFKFQDAGNKAIEDERRKRIKDKLIDAVKGDELERFRKTDDQIKSIKNKGVKKFYEAQNDALGDWLEVDSVVRSIADDILESFDPDRDHDGILEHGGTLQAQNEDVEAFLPEEERTKRSKAERSAKRAINVNVVANIFLLAAKIVACFFSSSLSLIASTVDSALDLLCTVIVWTTNRLVQWRLNSLERRFPVGRRRLEPLGILVFSIFMILSFAQILQESVEKLLPDGDHTIVDLGAIAMGAMIATIVVKGIIWFGCIRVKTTQVQALAQDCQTDVYFNTLSLIFPLIGKQVGVWWLDPVGAGILSLFIIWDWAGTAFENVTRLSGSAVDDRLFRKIIFLAWRFAPIVEGFKSIKAYHAGDGVWVEVDILLHPYTPLMSSHDIAETLQYCLEGLPEVDRAFVTTDYTESGPSGHASLVN
ncbi:hypothetical protein M406DRAFT_350276 [Cryphonectria parasitica EP155]|uniref:Cation efflux protein transmembrane domain-containing protein n=1 Tax=Cryphonectria parasitica (strain ATCC 38755 / EP155) TaxID=660469 RepID=A0A9P5CR25_CRYP1|nr:uncharacterized protein M406DRAFT_350276 [Cryphonectria parasitica EP155]KAF3766821.1 hypothetical protein M406DRAFT_350276 [Cryphonectria parasitica EP155]